MNFLPSETINKYSGLGLGKILRNVQVVDECWLIGNEYRTIGGEPAHRFIFKLFNPEVSIKGYQVCHKCDRPGCINPEHLFLGTAKDNQQDASMKGRKDPSIIAYEREKHHKKRYMKRVWKRSDRNPVKILALINAHQKFMEKQK